MPWTSKQLKVAEAVKHGWKPKGAAKGFTKKLASDIVVETNDGRDKSMIRKKGSKK